MPLATIAASVPNFPPNPVGEKLYRTQLSHELIPLVVILVCALLAMCVVWRLGHKAHKPDSP